MKKVSNFLLVVTVCGLLAGMGAATLILPPSIFSQRENRRLAKFPSPSVSSLLDGGFFCGISDYYSDQLPFRDSLGSLHAISEIALGKRESNGVLLRGNTLISRAEGDAEIYKYNLDAINTLLSRQERSLFFCPPESVEVYSHLLDGSEQGLLEAIPPQPNKLSEEYLTLVRSKGAYGFYYRTDHHWTTAGAFEAYKLLCGALGDEPYSQELFTISSVSESFLGSAYRRSSFPSSLISPDHIILYRYNGDQEFTVKNTGSMTAQQGFYDLEEIGTNDEYRVFLGGNCAHVSITRGEEEGRRRLLLIKDSFANSLIPFLALHYDVEMIDPRYADPSLAKKLCENENFDIILILCSKATLLSERSFGKALNVID